MRVSTNMFVKQCTNKWHLTDSALLGTRSLATNKARVESQIAKSPSPLEVDEDRLSCRQRAFCKWFVDVPEYCHSSTSVNTRISSIQFRDILLIRFTLPQTSAARCCTCLHWPLRRSDHHGESASQPQEQSQSTGRLQRAIARATQQKQLRDPSSHGAIW
jgi:hypothetical protein